MADLKLIADSGGGSVSLKAPSATTSNASVTLKLPVADGSANQLLKTDGSGQLGWATDSATDSTKLPLTGGTVTGDIVFDNSTNADNDLHWDESADWLKWDDNVKAVFGDGNDLKIYHSSSSGNNIYQGDSHQFWNSAGNEALATFTANSHARLYFNGTQALETNNQGVTIQGEEGEHGVIYLNADEGDDNADQWGIVASRDASTFNIQNFTSGAWEKNIECNGDGNVELYNDGVKKFETTSNGVKIVGYMKASYDGSYDLSGAGNEMHSNNVSSYDLMIRNDNASPGANYMLELNFKGSTPDNSTARFLDCRDATAQRFYIYSNGDYWSSDGGSVNSDETLKENIVDATPKLDDLKKLKVRNFNYKSEFHPNETHKRLGFIAQEVEQIFPGLVNEHRFNSKEEDTPIMKKAIKNAWAPILVKALQEAITKIETLETKVAALGG